MATMTATDISIDDRRKKIVDMLKSNSNLSDVECKDMEIGIYNWCIHFADANKIIKNWKNPVFVNMYIEKSRSMIVNINKDSYINNMRLLNRINEKEFLPHELAFMRPENVFPEKWKDTIDNHMKKYEYAYENKNVAVTDQFRCGKCKKRECTFFTMQTRSSDESETIFIRCINCGHQFRQ